MATRTTPDIEILVGVEGGGSISGASGVKIRNQLTNIISNINKQQATQLRLKVDQQYIQNQIANAIKTMPPVDLNVKVNPNGGGSGGGSTGGNSAVNQIQKIGSMVAELRRKKAKLLDLSSSTKEAQALNRQIERLKQNIANAKASYQSKSGKTSQEIQSEVMALSSVTKATDSYYQNVAKANDTYDAQIKKIRELKQNLEASFGNQKSTYATGDVDQRVKDQWAQYEKLYLSVQQKAKNILRGSFNTSDPAGQASELRGLINLYGQLEKMLSGVGATHVDVQKKSESATLSMRKTASRVYEFYQQIKDTAPADFKQKVLNLFDSTRLGTFAGTSKQATMELEKYKNEAYAAGYATEAFGQKIARVFKQKIGYGIMAAAAMKARQALRQLYTNVVEMDKAMTQLRIVTNDTDAACSRFAANAAKAAKSIGASVTDIMTSAETYARLGYTLDESLNLSATTAQLANVAATDAETATSFMTAILKGFRKNASDAEGIGDMLTLVGKKYAISAEELGAALERGGASMAAANNTLEESIALLAAGNAAVQNAETVGNAMKTVTMRIRGSSAEDLEEAGLATDNLCESTSKLREEIKALSGVDIMLNEDTYKSTYQILLEISQVWDRLTDVNRATLLETLAGKRNSQVLMSIIQNVDDLKGAYEDAQNASGTMADATSTYLDSISGKLDKLSASYQDLSSRVLDSEFVKLFVDAGIAVTEFFNNIDEGSKGAVTNMLAMAAAGASLVTIFQTLKKVATLDAVATTLASIGSAIFSLPGLAIMAGIAIAGIGTYAYKAYQDAHPSLEDLKADLEDLKQTANDTKSEIDTNIERITALQALSDNGTITLTEESELKKLKDENALLKQQYDIQQSLVEQQEQRVHQATAEKVDAYFKGTYTPPSAPYGGNSYYLKSPAELAEDEINAYKKVVSEINEEYKNADDERRKVDQKILSGLGQSRNEYQEKLKNRSDEIIGMMQDLDPEDTSRRRELQVLLDKIQLALNPNSVGSIVESTINSTYFEDAKKKLEGLASAGKLTQESVQALNDQKVNELIAYLGEIAGFTWEDDGQVQSLANQLSGVKQESLDLSQSLSGITDALSAVTAKYDLLSSAQKEFQETGVLSADTLSSIVEKYPELESQIGLYIAGMKSEQELLAGMSDAYATDVSNYKKSVAAKLATSPEFYNSLQENEKKRINDLADAYGIDLKNFKNLETAKLQFQAEIIKKLAANSARFHGSTIEELKAYQASVQSSLKFATEPRQKAYLASELQNVTNSLAAISKFQKEMDDIALNGVKYDPSKYSPSKVDGGASSSDKYKQNVEKEIKILQHKREMDLITDEEYYNQLEAIENKYYKDSAAHREKYKEEIWDLDQEIFNGRRDILSDWISDQEKIAEGFNLGGDLNSQKKVYEDILNEVEKMIDSAIKYGLDENSDYVQELRDQYHKTCQDILSMVQDSYDSFKSYADDFEMWDSFDFTKIEFLEKNLEEIKKLYQEGTLGWKEYVEAYNEVAKEIYDTKKESIETIIDMTMEMIEQEANDEIDALDDQIDKLNEIIDLKKKLLQDTKDEKDHEKQVAEAVSEIAKLQSKIAQLSLDDSREAIAKRADLEEQLAEKQKELADLQGDYALDKTLDVLDETKEAKEDEAEAEKKAIEKSIDSWVKKYKLAIDRIDNDWDNLYDDLNDWMAEHRDSIDGPDSLKTAWENVDQMVRQTGQDIESIYNGNGNIGINPDATTSSSAQAILDKMQANSAYALLNPGSGLSATNAKLADDYYKATGRKLYYNDSVGWVFDSKTSTNAAYEILGSKAKSNPYTAGTAQYGEKNSEAVKWIQAQLKAIGYKDQSIDGNYWQTTAKNVAAFAAKHHIASDGKRVTPQILKYLKAYHNGGIVDRTGAINDKEVLSILETGEIVLDDKKKATLSSIFGGIKASLSAMTKVSTMPYQRRVAAVGGYGDTFAPQVSVNISHNGKMTDRDAKRYGDIAADATLEKLRAAFNKRGVS
ncbi:MAG: phage tail tape measure protein [Prevotella copri]|nr:phage tail tape measure protein [Segatella copri]